LAIERVQLSITNYGFATQKSQARLKNRSEDSVEKVSVMQDPFHAESAASLIENETPNGGPAMPTVQRSAAMSADIFDSTDAPLTKTKLYMPRTSEVGYFRTVEVTKDEADRVMASEKRRQGRTAGAGAAVLRRSDLPFIDLTDAD
jgi:hypothetical protein